MLDDDVELIVGLEIDEPNWTAADMRRWKVKRRFQITNWAFASKPGSAALRHAIVMAASRYVAFTLSRGASCAITNHDVLELSGPGLFTDAIDDYLQTTANVSLKSASGISEPRRIGSILVLPVTAFASGQRHSGSRDFNDPGACLNHFFSSSVPMRSTLTHAEGSWRQGQ